MSQEPYLLITADTHAGGSHAQYREYLDPAYRERFDAWRGRYRNPSQEHYGTRKMRNWDHAIRTRDQNSQGVVGEVVFPNTVPPFFGKSVLTAQPPTPDHYELALAGIRAHNRWLTDFCAEDPDRRAGIGLILPNDLDEAVRDIEVIAAAGLRGGVLLPLIPPPTAPGSRPCTIRPGTACSPPSRITTWSSTSTPGRAPPITGPVPCRKRCGSPRSPSTARRDGGTC